jgi:hypothetical protein
MEENLNMRVQAKLYFFLFFTANFFLACTEPSSKTLSSGGGTSGPEVPSVSADAPLAIKVSTKFDSSNYVFPVTFAETGTTTCSASATTPNATCTVSIPEGRLYYSAVTLSFTWSTSACPLMRFIPYQYQASNADDYFAPATEVSSDCSVNASAKSECWAGAAKDVVSDFPKSRSLIYLPDETQSGSTSASLTINSGLSKNWGSNRWVSNSLIDKTTMRTSVDLGSIGDGYVANTMEDYSWTCRDQWADPKTYSITLKINDVDSDTGNGPINNILTWQGF